MPKVITRNALIQCPHGGIGQSVPSQLSVLIAGAPVLVEGDTGVILNCANLPPAGVPCAGYVLRSMNLNAVTVAGRRPIIDTDFEQSITGYPLVLTDLHQVEDFSLPGVVPPGGTFTVPPELQDTDHPSVVATPPVLLFSKTGTTPFLIATFTLVSQFPKHWILTMIVPPNSTDITSSAPVGVTVQPSGGSWTISPLTVRVTLTNTYMMTLPVLPVKVTFIMIAINCRGRSAFGETVLEVSP